jgi:hypothetical protein
VALAPRVGVREGDDLPSDNGARGDAVGQQRARASARRKQSSGLSGWQCTITHSPQPFLGLGLARHVRPSALR